MNGSSTAPIEISHVNRRFAARLALDDVSLKIPSGCVFGLVGGNGAGKTTLIKHILGLLRAEQGAVRVFGLDPVLEPPRVLSRIGYLSEARDLPGWMRVDELLRYTQAFYPKWDKGYAESLRKQFDLAPSAKIKNLSRGELAKAALLVALAYRPDLLVLDEPSSGLDPVVRRDILEAIVRTVADEGRTVFFSSHLLDEIERVSDRVAMIVNGRIILDGPLDEIRGAHHHLTLRFTKPQASAPSLPQALSVSGTGYEWSVVCNGGRHEVIAHATSLGARVVEQRCPTLDEIFVARVARKTESQKEGL
jgi:ABC-2 type transport system ATP-binding protein